MTAREPLDELVLCIEVTSATGDDTLDAKFQCRPVIRRTIMLLIVWPSPGLPPAIFGRGAYNGHPPKSISSSDANLVGPAGFAGHGIVFGW